MKSQYKDSQYPLSINEIEKLINSSKTFRDKLIIESLYFCGLRRFETCKMDIRDIDFVRGRINVIGKFNKLSTIPVGSTFPQFLTDLKHYIGNRKEGYVFLSNRNRKFELSRINQILDETAKIAGLKNPNPKKKHINPHCLRHSLARHLKSLGFPVEFVQNYLRHKKFSTTFDEYGTLGLDEMESIALQKRGIENKQLR